MRSAATIFLQQYLVTSVLIFCCQSLEEKIECENAHGKDDILNYNVPVTMSNSFYQTSDSETGSMHQDQYAVVPYKKDRILFEFYENKKYYTFPGVDGEILIKQQWQEHGIAGVVWEGATVLGTYLAKNCDLFNRRVLELGSGTGLVGIVAAKLGAIVTLTDLGHALPVLKANVALNFVNHLDSRLPVVRQLEWGESGEFDSCEYDLILGADIIYSVEMFDALLETLTHLTRCQNDRENSSKIILASKLRYDRVETFVEKAKSRFSSVKQLYADASNDVVIYQYN